MAFQKGHEKKGGRQRGVANKATLNAKQAIADFVDGNSDRLVGWLDRIAEDNPKEAFQCFMSVVEYHIPKLARTESDVNMNAKVDYTQLPAMPQEQVQTIEGDVNGRYGSLPPQLH